MENKKTHVVAIVSYTHGSITNKIIEGFQEVVNKSEENNYTFIRNSANGNPKIARSLIQTFIKAKVDLIFTVGCLCTEIAKKMTEEQGIKIPIVFGAVNDPVKIKLIESEESSGNNLTGVTDITPQWGEQLALIRAIRPNSSRATIACNYLPGQNMENMVKNLKNLLEKNNIQTQVARIYNTTKFMHEVTPFLNNDCDILFSLRDNIVINAMEEIATICNQKQITICSAYLDAVKKGAAFGFGIDEKTYGIKSGQLAREILEHGKRPDQLPIIKMNMRGYLHINQDTAPYQGFSLESALRIPQSSTLQTK